MYGLTLPKPVASKECALSKGTGGINVLSPSAQQLEGGLKEQEWMLVDTVPSR